MRDPVISIVSFFNSANLGDLLIADALTRRCQAFGSVHKISFSGDPFVRISPEDYRQDCPATVPEAARSALMSKVMTSPPATRLYRRRWQRRGIREEICKKFSESDLVVIGGGNMIFDLDRWTNSAENFRYFASLARELDIPVLGMSLGIGPFATSRQARAATRALDLCQQLTFRDERSRDLYRGMGHRPSVVTVDPVLMLPARLSLADAPGGSVAFNLADPRFVQGSSQASQERVTTAALEIILRLLDSGLSVRMFSTDRADLQYLRSLLDKVGDPRCSLVPLSGFNSLLSLYRDSDVVIGGRMHALIVAATQGRPIVGLAWQQKVNSFFGILDRPSQVFPVDAMPAVRIVELVNRMRAHPDEFITSPGLSPQLQARAKVDEQLLTQALGQLAA